MLNCYIYNLLDQILPSSDKSIHDILRLEYLSAIKIMENGNLTMKILPHIPDWLFEPLLQSVIYKCYLEFINIDDISPRHFHKHLNSRNIAFPDSLAILILNWPYEEIILRNKIPSLHPPVELFPSVYDVLASQNQTITLIEEIEQVFHIFCNRLIQFIISAVFKCTSANTSGYSCHLRKLDVSGLGYFYDEYSREDNYLDIRCFSHTYDILEGISNSTIETFGHKIEIVTDVEFILETNNLSILSNIINESLNPVVGISLYFKKVTILSTDPKAHIPCDFFSFLSIGRCEYIQLDLECHGFDKTSAEKLSIYLPELVGFGVSVVDSYFYDTDQEVGTDFLSAFEYLEHLNPTWNTREGLFNNIDNLSKGLKYLELDNCFLESQEFECLAKSKHSTTLLQLDLTDNHIDYYDPTNNHIDHIENNSEARGLIMLCQNLKNIKILIVDDCSLDKLSSRAVSKLVTALKDCDQLKFLSMRRNSFSLEMTNIIIDGLAQNKSLRYLSLSLPGFRPTNERKEYLHNLFKTFHEKINKYRETPIYISWSHGDLMDMI